jgi:hypothetical protein
MRIVLRPAAGSEFGDGATAVRGQLFEDAAVNDPVAIAGVIVQLAWQDVDHADGWTPTPPSAAYAAAEAGSPSAFRETRTDDKGQFLVMLAAVPAGAHLSATNGLVAVRLQFTRLDPAYQVKTTPAQFPFLPPADAPGDHVPQGRLLTLDRPLSWKQLHPEDP